MINQTQGHAIAKAVAALRDDWDPAGILHALGSVKDRDPAAVLIAFARAARNPGIRTPAVAAMQGPHWHDPTPSTASRHPSSTPLGELCPECYRHACDCDPATIQARRHRENAAERTARWAALARQQIHHHDDTEHEDQP